MRGPGSGKTPDNIVKLMNEAVKKSSMVKVAKEIGIAFSATHRYVNGTGEPTLETLKKISTWSGKPVSWLLGEE